MVDVARRAGVSLKTVSRVVNGEPGVNERTAAKVQSAIEALGFRRHDGASNLRRGHTTASLGLVLEDVSDPFYSAVTRAVEEVARNHQFLVFAGSSDETAERERELALAFCARRVDGLLIVPAGTDHTYLKPEIRAGTMAVFMDRPAGDLDADSVLVDNAGGTLSAVAHLAGQGHRRIGYLGDSPAIYTAQERLRGYREGMEDAGLPPDPGLIAMGPHTEESLHAALDRFAAGPDPVTALVTGNNRTTVRLIRVLGDRGRPWPALVGFDDFELADMLDPPVTVVEQSPLALGRQAAELLFSRLAGDRGPVQRIVLPTRLVPRGSGEVRL
jgi:LacI family transcriptional regulator